MHRGSIPLSPFTLWRLFARWQLPLVLWGVAMACMLPTLFVDDNGLSVLFDATRGGEGDDPAMVRQLLLHAAVWIPLAIAVAAGSAEDGLMSSAHAWTLPRVGERLLAGHVLVIVLLSSAIGLVFSLRTDGRTAFLAAGMVPFWYAAGIAFPAVLARRELAYALLAALGVGLFWPRAYVWIVSAVPVSVAIAAALMGSGGILHLRRTPLTGRVLNAVTREALTHFTIPGGFGRSHQVAESGKRFAAGTPVRSSLSAWVLAAVEESGGARIAVVLQAMLFAFLAAFTFFLSTSSVVMLFSGWQRGLQLSGTHCYPMARRTRAHVQFICSALDLSLMMLVASTVFALLHALPLKPLGLMSSTAPQDWRIELLVVAACAPIVQWARVLGPLPNTAIASRVVYMSIAMIAAAVLPRFVVGQLQPHSLLTQLAAMAAIVLASQLVHFLALRYVYDRRDLVPRR